MSPIAGAPARAYQPAAPEPAHAEPARPAALDQTVGHDRAVAHDRAIGRIPVTKVSPVIEGGAYPAKAAVGELFPIRATVFRDGHDAVSATVVLTAPDGRQRTAAMAPCEPIGFDRWEAWVRLDQEGLWTFRVEGWDDPWRTWAHNAEIKVPAGIDLELVFAEGAELFAEALSRARGADDRESVRQLAAAAASLSAPTQAAARLAGATTATAREAMARHAPRRLVTPSADRTVFCDRRAALFSSWYEFFPRSQGAHVDEATGSWVSGTFDSSYERLEAASAMGFDVVYLPPIHPIGQTYRKGPNNTLTPGPDDPGSPWAIGSAAGGHDAIHPELGDWDSFDRFVAKAGELGLQVALDLALQASPDHPWVTEHPAWFTTRVDGTIAYAENPPKKYQDIYPVNFDNDPEGLYAEVLRIVRLWMSHGVRIFRVDNPHTKPVAFWAWLLGEIRATDPDVVFLAEAFTAPEMMQLLGKVGFHQSYTYFTWRNEKWDLTEYLTAYSRDDSAFMRPNFFVNTPDILPGFLQTGGPAAFTIRAVLAATLSPAWGVYSGFELFEHEAVRPGSEEYLDSEKYQYRPRDFAGADARGESLSLLLGRLNQLRREHAALQQLRDLTFHHVPAAEVIAYSKSDVADPLQPDGAERDTVIVVCLLDPHRVVETEVYLDLPALGLSPDAAFEVREQLTGQRWRWGARNFVRLTPDEPAHVLTVHPIGPPD